MVTETLATSATLAAKPNHPWKLVAPWYRWDRAAVPADGRRAAPALQKFSGSEFVTGFMADPQHSLKFDPVVDVVSYVDLLPALSGGNLAGKLAGLFATKADGTPVKPADTTPDILKNLHRSRLVPSDLRKLYLPIHDRHYLVVCELHCDVPGFPTVPRGEACQAGFVVRRRQRVVPAALANEAASRAQTVRQAEAWLAELKELSPLRDDLAERRKQQLAELKLAGSFASVLSQAESSVTTARHDLQSWFTANGITTRVESWFPLRDAAGKPSKTLGEWREPTAAEQATDLTKLEHFFPLYPLIPDPSLPKHDAAGRTQYYGMVPATGLQHEGGGRPRFDDTATYEIVCFVRRHKANHPRHSGRVPDCCGEVVWSAATEPYRLAAPFDTLGCANRPITIKMPDLRELAAQIAARPRGKLSPVRVIQPQHLSPKVSDKAVSGGDMGGNAICFFSIPLITIIALFVLNLFLPIVVFIFQLWFLLLFRFCIPPQIKFSADLDAKLAAQPPSVDFDADFAIDIDGVPLTAVELHDALVPSIKTRLEQAGPGSSPEMETSLKAYSNNALAPLGQSLEDAKNMPTDPDVPPPGLDYGTSLEYETRREPQWQLEGGRG